MTIVTIPLRDDSVFDESVTLDGNEYKLHFYWNQRGQSWFMDISDANGNALVSGIFLAISLPLTMQYKHIDGMPQGDFLVRDDNPKNMSIEAGRHDFTQGRNLQLIYWNPLT